MRMVWILLALVIIELASSTLTTEETAVETSETGKETMVKARAKRQSPHGKHSDESSTHHPGHPHHSTPSPVG
ncbi:hypothetical protein GCK32_007961 [Trichostrongylus colubriformis]|uniref:Secreted protein n=1 Tax=Trichostrongylus colubriformis TaxID=6319 RepID=A0AAN8FYB4_TRICO